MVPLSKSVEVVLAKLTAFCLDFNFVRKFLNISTAPIKSVSKTLAKNWAVLETHLREPYLPFP